MASATLTVNVNNGSLTLTPTDVSPENSVAVFGNTLVNLVPQSSTDTTFTLSFVSGPTISSLSSVTLPAPFGDSSVESSGGPNPIVVTANDVEPFQNMNFDVLVGFTPKDQPGVVISKDPTIVFNPPST